MPNYTYECTKCYTRFDLFHSIADSSMKYCPKCGGEACHIISGGAGLIFKGSGFYETDYKAKNNSFNGDGKKHKETELDKESPAENSDVKSSAEDDKPEPASKNT